MSELPSLIQTAFQDMNAYKNDCFEKASIFDAQIAAENAQKSEHILKVTVLIYSQQAASRFRRIIVTSDAGNGHSNVIRKLEPHLKFSELQLKCEALHPEFVCVLTVPGTNEVVGSQMELLCAYEDAPEESEILHLNLTLHLKSLKRRIDEVEEPEIPETGKHIGRWMPSEMALFRKGLENFGWGSWARISSFMETRSKSQVKAFANTAAGLENKIETSFLPVLKKIADGLTEVSKNVTREMTK